MYFKNAMLTVIIAVLMSFDAFVVGISYGIKKIRISASAVFVIALCSVISGYVSIFLGSRIAAFFPPDISTYIGSGILIAVGLWFLIQSILPVADISEKKTLAELAIKSLGITITIVRNPLSMDLNKSGNIEISEAVAIGIALAVDVMGAGLALGAASSAGFFLPLIIGISEIIFIKSGFIFGSHIDGITDKFKTVSGILPGLIMIIIAIIKLFM